MYAKNMNNKILALSGVGALLLSLTGCSQMTPEIVEFDPSYKAEQPKGIKRDTVSMPPIDLLTKYLFFKDNNQVRTVSLQRQEDGSLAPLPMAPVDVVAKLSLPVDEAVTAKIVPLTADNYPATFKDLLKGEVKLLPADMYTLSASEVTFEPKELEKKVSLTVDVEKAKELDQNYTYLVPLVLEFPKEGDLKEYNYFLLSISVKEVLIKEGQNVSHVPGWTANGLSMISNADISVDSDYKADRLAPIKDGNSSIYSSNWWVPSGQSNYLTIAFPKKKVKALRIYGHSDIKNITKVSVAVSDDGGAMYYAQGSVENPNAGSYSNGSPLNIVFAEPYEIDQIKLTDFVGNQSFINIVEVEVYY